MKKLIISLLVIAAFVVAPISLFAANAEATDHAVGKATLITPITITKVTDLDFGVVASSSTSAGTAVIDSISGALSVTGGAQIINSDDAKAASFTVTGQEGQSFSIVRPDNISLLLTGQTPLSVALQGAKAGSLSGVTSTTITIGGVMTVPSNSVGGTYQSANFDVVVAYN